MVQSPVKFDDLAFILLFFFLMVAVISFAQADELKVQQSSKSESSEEVKPLELYLDEKGNFLCDGSLVHIEELPENCSIDLSCNSLLSWEQICNAVNRITELGDVVCLVM